MSERITEAIAALRSASEISSAQDALKALSGLVEGLTLEDAQVGELQGELAEVDANVEELQLALNLAKADLDKFKESHRFFSRAFGSERREWRKLRKAIKERAAALARGQALEISLTLLLDQAAGAEGRPTGLRAAEWRTRIETATGEGAEALGAVLVALRDESKNDEKLIGGLQEALATHTRAMKRAKLRKLVRMMRKGLGGVADDIQLQEALFNDALTTLRTLVEAEQEALGGYAPPSLAEDGPIFFLKGRYANDQNAEEPPLNPYDRGFPDDRSFDSGELDRHDQNHDQDQPPEPQDAREHRGPITVEPSDAVVEEDQ